MMGLLCVIITFLTMIALHFYANTTQNGLYIMLKNVGIAVTTYVILSVPTLVRSYR